MNEKAKKELTTDDQEVLSGILSKSNEVLTKEEKAHLTARRAYLTKEELETYKITGKVEEELDPDPVNEEDKEVKDDDGEGPADDTADYSGLKKAELEKECEKRDIEVPAKATVADMIELLEADDRGELEDDDEEDE